MEPHKDILNEKSPDPPMPMRKAYEKPVLEVLGDVRSLTLGGSQAGLLESGGRKSKKL